MAQARQDAQDYQDELDEEFRDEIEKEKADRKKAENEYKASKKKYDDAKALVTKQDPDADGYVEGDDNLKKFKTYVDGLDAGDLKEAEKVILAAME